MNLTIALPGVGLGGCIAATATGASQLLNMPFSGKPRQGWPVYSNGTPQSCLFFSGAAGRVERAWTPSAAPLKNKIGIGVLRSIHRPLLAELKSGSLPFRCWLLKNGDAPHCNPSGQLRLRRLCTGPIDHGYKGSHIQDCADQRALTNRSSRPRKPIRVACGC